MTDRQLARCRILIVEDEYLLADELAIELAELGATVLGPAPDVQTALRLLSDGEALNGAVLDINLGGEPAFPVADRLIAQGVPIVFTTGYDAAAMPDRFKNVPRCEKPFSIARMTAAMVKAFRPSFGASLASTCRECSVALAGTRPRSRPA
ncbi:response regulator [Sphingomonas sp. BK580]|uniref:response regulator n=1 Tax=Sphingomonas sp. BK580 TaxID=2586972 RepID=UPI0017E2E574|nr:response regulator [Sphingomonas sp. BK580]MBB3691952.1 DNA-binding LytR/AlgR family response regulator [Sphingomonas sp. BK580]